MINVMNELKAAYDFFAQKYNFPTNAIREGIYKIPCGGFFFIAEIKYGGIAITSTAQTMAMNFHSIYEKLAPDFSYETRKESATQWELVPKNNKELMIATCAELLKVKPN